MSLVECIPNFSEGRDLAKIKEITNSIESVDGITLLDVDPGSDTNRTVVTFIGNPKAVEKAAFLAIKTASEVIDMTQHEGAHSRIGATDVCPFVPIKDFSDKDCIKLSMNVAKRVGDELKIPIYLYEKSAKKKYRRSLPDIRKGEYEGLSKKLNNPKWKPDYGPSIFNPRSGATIIGSRDFLIAYNINLNTKDKRLATDIAFELRESGRSKRIPNPKSPNLLDGKIVRNSDGTPVKISGMFKDVKAVGWYIDTFKQAQISINFNNYKISTIHDVFDAACRLAEQRGLRVTGSELVGLVPEEALIMAGNHYLKKQNKSLGIPKDDIIATAIMSLGLNDVVPFDPNEKIIENVIRIKDDLSSLSLNDFIDELSRNSFAPGGGSVSALAGSLGAALISMVANLTHDKKNFFHLRKKMNEVGSEAQSLIKQLLLLVDEDTKAYNKVVEINRLPASTEKELKNKKVLIREANEYAINVPLKVISLSLQVLELGKYLVINGNPNSVSDVGVGAEVALAASRGAAMNVLINLKDIEDSKDQKVKEKKVLELTNKAESIHQFIHDKTLKIIAK